MGFDLTDIHTLADGTVITSVVRNNDIDDDQDSKLTRLGDLAADLVAEG